MCVEMALLMSRCCLQIPARLFLSFLACHFSDVTIVSQLSLASHFRPSVAFIAIKGIIYFTNLSHVCLNLGRETYRTWCFVFLYDSLLYCDSVPTSNIFSSSVLIGPMLIMLIPQIGRDVAVSARDGNTIVSPCIAHLSCDPMDTYAASLFFHRPCLCAEYEFQFVLKGCNQAGAVITMMCTAGSKLFIP